MPRNFRSFIAVDFPVPSRVRSLIGQLGSMGKAVRAVPAGNVHVTLKFLGDVDPNEMRSIAAIVEEACQGIEAFDAKLVGLGAFPRLERPSVVWIGLERAEPLVEIADRLEAALAPLGYPPEGRAFTPHLTVARVKFQPPPELGELFEQHATTPFGNVPIRRVVLFESAAGSQGPEYVPLATSRL